MVVIADINMEFADILGISSCRLIEGIEPAALQLYREDTAGMLKVHANPVRRLLLIGAPSNRMASNRRAADSGTASVVIRIDIGAGPKQGKEPFGVVAQ